MVRRRDGNKVYRSGDPIHIVVTQDFVDDANRFFSHCRERGYNPSQIIRQAMKDWLKGEENGDKRPVEIDDTNEDNGFNFDTKLMELIRDKPKMTTPKKRMSLKTVKEILEEN